MQRLSLQGKYALVTGASAGLGREMARQIATVHGGHLVLVARRKERLEELARELEPGGTQVVCIAADLSKPDEGARVFNQATEGREIHAAILNAGVTYFGHHLDFSFAEQQAMLHTNVVSVLQLAHALLHHQLQRSPGGGALVISSFAGTVPTPYQALYAGCKALLNTWGVALAEELAGKDVSLTVFAPGGIATEMGEKSGTGRKFKKGDVGMMDADVCARAALSAFMARKRFVIPGALNWLNNVMLRLAPRTLQAAVMANLFRSALAPLPAGDAPPRRVE
ncbi:MAG: SDR family NAD(P)-dependent oxidoreductase [Archangiaceae bacterium]|nr:SDR family NAD(P)-dependent oxidoreductase [Archangiaceae bacterium]